MTTLISMSRVKHNTICSGATPYSKRLLACEWQCPASVTACVLTLLVIALVSNVTACSGRDLPPTARDEAKAQEVFAAFRNAVVTKLGRGAAALVSTSSMEYAAHLQELALYAPRDVLEAAPVSAEMYVLLLRLNLTAQQLQSMLPADVLAFGIEKGIIGNLWQADDQLHGFRFITSGVGSGERVRNYFNKAKPVGAPIRLVREGFETWRMDILPELEALDENMRSLAKDRQLSERTVARAVVEFYSMKRLQPRDFEPMRTPEPGQQGGHDA